MATTKQRVAARKNLEKARKSKGRKGPGRSKGITTAKENRLSKKSFAFPKERKEPLVDAAHVRNAVARFDQVEGVSKSERDSAWKRIKRAAKRHGVEIEAKSWRDLGGGQAKAKGKGRKAKKG
jgi:hypothetical protein